MNSVTESHLNTATTALAFVTFVIGTLGVAGHIPNPALGWVTVGLGATSLVLGVAHWANSKHPSFERLALVIIYSLALITIGILGGLNVLTFKQTGWILVPPSLTKFIVLLCCISCAGWCTAKNVLGK